MPAMQFSFAVLVLFVASGHAQFPPGFPVNPDVFIPTNLLELPQPIPVEPFNFASFPYNGDSSDLSYSLITSELFLRDMQIWPTFVSPVNSTSFDPAVLVPLIEGQLAIAIATVNGVESLLTIASRPCGESIIKFLTALLLPPTWIIDYDFSLPPFNLPVSQVYFRAFPSQATCQAVEQFCTPFYGVDGVFTIMGNTTCDDVFNLTLADGLVVIEPQLLYPISTTNITVGGGLVNVQIPGTDFLGTPVYVPECEDPLSLNEDAFEAGDPTQSACQDHCLGYIFYTENQWDAAKVLLGVLSWCCLILDTNLMIVLLMSPKNRKYPGIMSVFMTIAGLFICLPFVVGSVIDMEEMLCTDEFTPATSDHGLCVWQASFLLFGALMGLLTWSSLAVNTYVTLHLRWKIDNQKWGIITYCITLGYPTIAVIVGTSTKDFQYSPPTPWCWWGTSGLEWGMFYSVNILCCLVSLFCIVFVLYELRNIQDSSKGKRAKYLKLLRVFAFLILFLEIAVYLITIQSIVEAREDDYLETGTAYVRCLYFGPYPCDRPKDGTIGVKASQWYWVMANVAGVGLPVVIVFGTTGPVFFFWCRAVKNISAGKALADGLTSTSSSSASSRGSWAGPQDGDEDSFDPDA